MSTPGQSTSSAVDGETRIVSAVGVIAQTIAENIPDDASGFDAAEIILSELTEAGYSIVPFRADARAIASVLPQIESPDKADLAVGSAACSLLPQTETRHDPHGIAGEMARDFRNLVSALAAQSLTKSTGQ